MLCKKFAKKKNLFRFSSSKSRFVVPYVIWTSIEEIRLQLGLAATDVKKDLLMKPMQNITWPMLIQPILFKNRICIYFRKIIAYLKHLEPSGFSHQNSWTSELKYLLIILCEIAHNLCSFNQFCLKNRICILFRK